MLPFAFSITGVEVAARGEDGDISNRIDRENFLRELIKTMNVAGEDAHTPHTSQVMCEQCSALYETLAC